MKTKAQIEATLANVGLSRIVVLNVLNQLENLIGHRYSNEQIIAAMRSANLCIESKKQARAAFGIYGEY